MLIVTVTLTFHRLTSKSILIIYSLRRMSVPNLRNLGQLCVSLSSRQCLVCINMLMVTVTLTFQRLTSKSILIIYSPRRMSVPNLRNLGQFCVSLSSRQGLVYINMLIVTVTLTFHRLTSKSIGIIYSPRRMSVPYLTNLGQFCV